jgi:RHS repeat-associated protein
MVDYSGRNSADNSRSGTPAAPTPASAPGTEPSTKSDAAVRGASDPGKASAGDGQGPPSLLPALSLPKGGGAIRGIGEKFSVNAATGTASLGIPIAASPGRSGFGPAVDLSYDSGNGNGPFGLGFHLSVPQVTRKTDKGLPRYLDDEESDEFILSGAEDLVPTRDAQGGLVTVDRGAYLARAYRPRVEGAFSRIERWVRKTDGDAHWRITSRDNVTNIYGQSAAARIQDPKFSGEGRSARTFTWLLEFTQDDKGNVVKYVYKAEDGAGVEPRRPSEKSRFEGGAFTATAQRYLKRVLYTNSTPFVADDFLMELVFDYGEHLPIQTTNNDVQTTTATAVPTPSDAAQPWPVRVDPFSTYRSTFEIRTYRLCRRVLMFHRFADKVGGVRPALLVKSTDFTYEPGPAFTYLIGITQAGYLFDAANNNWQREVLPTLVLDYARPVVNDALSVLPKDSLVGLEGGIDGARKQWVDLDGEGIPGVLIDDDSAWYYKANAGTGLLTAPRVLPTLPSPASLSGGTQQLQDLAGDGQLDLVSYDAPLSGYFTRTTDGGFEPLRAFRDLPNINWQDPNLRFIDLDGDGLPDLLLSEDDAFVWYHSEGKQGFSELQRVVHGADDDRGPAVVFADGTQSIQLADMSGGGLTDIVRIRNGEVSYWPNLGYGRFGKKITLENSPLFAGMDEFDARRVRFGDIDGSGTSDLFYLGTRGISLYFNQSGNALSAATPIFSLPAIDSLAQLTIVDLLGQGTACLVWSSPLPSASRPVMFIDLMNGQKPHLMKSVTNNLGARTELTYATSTKFYLADKAAGKPWLTRLSFPVHVLERVDHFDAISKSHLTTSYSYHHGFFDGVEREFRGFARVEQIDAEEFTVGPDTELFQAPVRTVTWFHTGAWLEKERLETALQLEYFPPGPKTPTQLAMLLADTVLPSALSIQDEREAARALRGHMLRQEVYANDASPQASLPYLTTEQNVNVRLLQSSTGAKHGVFFTHPLETVSVHSERNPDDPRVTHELVVEVDEFGNLKRKVSIAYGRAGTPDDLQVEQQRFWATLTDASFVNQSIDPTFYRVGVGFETKSYELTGLTLPAGGQGLLSLANLTTFLGSLPAEQPFESVIALTTPAGRLISHTQQLFYAADLLNPLPLGQINALALPYESYQLALTTGLVSFISTESGALSGTAFAPALLLSEGKYVQRDANYWTASGRVLFDGTSAQHFYLPKEAVDPFGNHSFISYDAFDLLPVSARDALNNTVQSENDYRVLGPKKLIDPNLNSSSVAFDALGMVIATAVAGKGSDIGDTLADPTTRLEYDLFQWKQHQKPAFAHSFAREVHGPSNPRFQESFAYSDGFGRIAMQKVQAEPGDVPNVGHVDDRWVGTGRTVFNNKGNPVKQYEPFFSATSDFEDEDAIVATGVTPVIHYDALDRVIRTELPNGTESRVEFDPWLQKTFDPNDAVEGTRWLSEHQSGSADDQRAATLALKHANTPTIVHFDALGRAFLTEADNGPDPADPSGPHRMLATRTAFDVQGDALSIADALGIVTIRQRFDVLKRRLEVDSPDAGRRLAVADVAGKPLRAWDSRGQTHRQSYDALQRPTRVLVKQGSTERLLLRTVYGEALDAPGVPQLDPAQTPSAAQALNLRGRAHHAYDCAGLLVSALFDFKGNPLSVSRRVAKDYTTEPEWSDGDGFESPSDVLDAVSNLLEGAHFNQSSTYDALNRVTSHTTPDQSITVPTYNRANLLETISVTQLGSGARTVIANLDYNARGQRTLCQYGNGTSTTYTYETTTFRLIEVLTLRGTTKLQDLVYTYDPVGNIAAMRNNADNAPFFSGATVVSGDGLYEYDAIYRLTSATGREHPGTQPVDTDPPTGTALPHSNDLEALLLYTETYSYDDVGNIQQIKHIAGNGGSNGWTRNYRYAPSGQPQTNNRLLATSVPGSENNLSLTYSYDPHGSMASMPHLQVMEWDYADRLRHTRPLASGTDQDTYFTYDGGGQRVRKVHVAAGQIVERIYLGGYEVYRERPATTDSSPTLERQTLHVMDDTRRVALIDSKTISGGSTLASPVRIWRFQLDNHLGSAMVELDETGAVITYEEYHPYGSTAFATTNGNAEVSAKRYRYTGKEKDLETGLYYHGARYYAPWLGRWTAADPAGIVDGPNLYRYSGNNVVNFADPKGTEAKKPDDSGANDLVDLGTYVENGQTIHQYSTFAGDFVFEETDDAAPAAEAKAKPTTKPPPAKAKTKTNNDPQSGSGSTEPNGTTDQDSDNNVGEPGFAESLIPIWGSGRSAVSNFQKGNIGTGIFYAALAVSDVFLVKSLVTAGGKLLIKGAATVLLKESAEVGEKVVVNEGAKLVAQETATVAAKEAAQTAEKAATKGLVALDTNAIIAALQEGKTAAVDAAIGGRTPIVPIAAAKEFIAANGKAGATALREFLAARGGRLAAAGTEASATGLRAQAASLGRSLRLSDSRIAAGAIREGVPLITNDKKFFNFLKAIGYSVENW